MDLGKRLLICPIRDGMPSTAAGPRRSAKRRRATRLLDTSTLKAVNRLDAAIRLDHREEDLVL
jgi:hypothetical protein